jgi:hypothetical protein
MILNKRIASVLLGVMLGLGLALPTFAQQTTTDIGSGVPKFTVPSSSIGKGFHFDADAPPVTIMPRGGGSFGGGGGRSFGGGGGGFGGSSSPRGGGSFGGGSNRSFGGTGTSPRTTPGGSSFGGRTGAMGSRSPTTGTNISGSGPRGYSSGYYGGHSVYYAPGGYWGGYSYGWHNPMWYYYTPFYPTFYFNPPYADNYGYYHPGGFSFIHALGGLCCCPIIFIGIIWMFTRGFGGKKVKYTTYQ